MDAEVFDGGVRFCLVFPSEALSVPVMRRVLGGTLLSFGADEDCVADILLAASEACTNVLRHGGRSTEYEVSASLGPNACLLEIANGASPGEPSRSRYPDAKRPASQPNDEAAMTVPIPVVRVAETNGTNGANGANGPSVANGDDQLQESGRGLHIMRACVDDLTLRGTPGRGTVVSMRKRLTWAPEISGRHAGGPASVTGARPTAALAEAG
jgi:serine/threonine-protein kinase RsbW